MMPNNGPFVVLATIAACAVIGMQEVIAFTCAPSAFSPLYKYASTRPRSGTAMELKIPFTGGNNGDGEGDESTRRENGEEKKEKIGLSSLLQLITAGAGSPFLGDFEGVDEETGNFMFSLEANNLVDKSLIQSFLSFCRVRALIIALVIVYIHQLTDMLLPFLMSRITPQQDGNSKQTQAPYFESGWVPEEDLEKEKNKTKKGGWFNF